MFCPNVTCSRLRREDRTWSVRTARLQRVPAVRCGQATRELQQTPNHGYSLLNTLLKELSLLTSRLIVL